MGDEKWMRKSERGRDELSEGTDLKVPANKWKLGLKLKLNETGEEVNNCPMPINSPTISFQLRPEPFKLNGGVI